MNKNINNNIYSKNIFSSFFFYYIGKLISFGAQNDLNFNNIPNIEPELNFFKQKNKFLNYIKKNNRRSLKKNIIYYTLPTWFFFWLYYLILNGSSSVIPIFLKLFIMSFQNDNFEINQSLINGSIIFLLVLIKPYLSQHGLLFGFKSTTKMYSIFSVIILNKILKLSNKSKNKIDLGKITSYLTVDINKVIICIMTCHHIISTPILFILYTIILSLEIGLYSLITPAIIIFFIFILYIFIRPLNIYAKKKLIFGDQRGKFINETINGIKIIKMNAWENIIIKKILSIRFLEKKLIFLINFIRQFQDGILTVLPILIGFIVISIYIYFENSLSTGEIFYLILIFNFFTVPLKVLTISLIYLFEANTSWDRLNSFYDLEEINEYQLKKFDESLQNENNLQNMNKGEIILKGSFHYNLNKNNENLNKKITQNKNFEIKNLNLNIKKGEFIGIIGKVGSGKSSFLKIILDELEYLNNESKVLFKGNISYIPQESFLINDTLRNNILFGNEYKKTEYEEILKICELEDDINILQGKDLTEIGERGINLSGGQKQRVSIGRSVYNNSDIYLIDDALSALDADVGQKIFNNVLLNNLNKKNKTIIMATHAIQYIHKVDKIIILENGKIQNIGSYDYLIKNDKNFKLYIETHINIKNKNNKDKKINILESKLNLNRNEKEEIEKGKIIEKEKKHEGLISFYIFKRYIKYGGTFLFVMILLLNFIFIGGKLFGDYWITAWSNNIYNLSYNEYFLYYLLIVVIIILIRLLNSYLFSLFTSNSSINIFKDLIYKIIKKKISYFDTTPIGEILNLTNKDIDFVDINWPRSLSQLISLITILFGTIIFVSFNNIIILPIFIIFFIAIIFSFIKFLKVTLELRRLSQLVYSPLLSKISEIINGFNLFKVFNKIDYQKKKFELLSEKLVNIVHLETLSSIWISFKIEWFITFIIGFLIYFIIIGFNFKWNFVVNNIELIGLSLSYTILIITYSNLLLFYGAEAIKNFSSVERIILNVNNENSESDWNIPEVNKKNWLEDNNNFLIKDLKVKYREKLPFVLKNLNFEIKNNEKIGLVGRTGSGKSSFILALMRMLENDGEIKIDDVDINTIGLHYLRKNLKLIPQDPFIIEGNLRENIDPLNEHKEEDIRNALQKIFENDLNKFKIDENGNNIDYLNYNILGKGKNLSLGQKQLICICRILLGKHKILLMDEATSNIDFGLDKKIQKIIKSEFKDSIIITIAHRLNTIIEYDKIIFLKDGEIKEIGSPKELLKKENGYFYNLVKENGEDFFNKMINIVNKI